MNLTDRNHPCGEKEQAGDEIRGAEIIPAEKKSRLGMNLGGRNNPYGRKEQARDESGR